MNKRQELDTLSRNLFFSGLIVARFSKVSLPIVANGAFILSALLYFSGYVVWQASVNEVNSARNTIVDKLKARFERDYFHMPQYSFAAVLGIAASLALVASLFMPQTFGLISAWLFMSSNIFWWWAEDINIKRLREDKPGSAEQKAREMYYSYTNLTTLNSIIYAASLTLYLIYPALAFPLGLVVSTTLLASTIQTFHYWAKSAYANNVLTEKEVGVDLIELNNTYIEDLKSYSKLLSRKDFSPILESEATKDKPESNKLSITEVIEPTLTVISSSPLNN